MFVDGLRLKRSWGGEVRNVSLLVAISVNDEGFRKVLAVAEGSKEDKASWTAFLRYLKERGLQRVRLPVSDKCLGLVESLGEFNPEALWQRCAVRFCRNAWTADVRTGIEETLFYYTFPREHCQSLRTNNPLERLLREVRRGTRSFNTVSLN